MLTVNPIDNPSFKAVNVIQVRQTAFTNPKDIEACKRQVNAMLGGGGDKFSLCVTRLLGYFFKIKPKNKIMTHGNGEIVEAPKKEGYHTFSVITGEEVDRYIDLTSFSNSMWIMNNFHVYDDDFFRRLSGMLRNNFCNKPSQEITVETLNELKAYIGKV